MANLGRYTGHFIMKDARPVEEQPPVNGWYTVIFEQGEAKRIKSGRTMRTMGQTFARGTWLYVNGIWKDGDKDQEMNYCVVAWDAHKLSDYWDGTSYSDKGYFDLAEAVVKGIIEEYAVHLKKYAAFPTRKHAAEVRGDEQRMRSGYFEMISCGADPEAVISHYRRKYLK